MTDSEIRASMLVVREAYIAAMKAEMLGPGSEFSLPDAEHELISSPPTARYSIGILFPQGNVIHHDNDETIAEEGSAEGAETSFEPTANESMPDNQPAKYLRAPYEGEEPPPADDEQGDLDEEISLSAQYAPSSMGITFLVRGNCNRICGSVSFATYRRAQAEECVLPFHPTQPKLFSIPAGLKPFIRYDIATEQIRLKRKLSYTDVRSLLERDAFAESDGDLLRRTLLRLSDYCRTGYIRTPHEITFTLDFGENNHTEQRITQMDNPAKAKIVALRRHLHDDIWFVTTMLVNAHLVDGAGVIQQERCIFQARLEIGTEKNAFSFVEKTHVIEAAALDEEERSLALLYRHKKDYGTGLGTSIGWSIDESGNGSLWNDFFPIAEVPSVDFSLPPNDGMQDEELSMKYLSDLGEATKEQRLSSLTKLVALYQQWAEGLKAEADTLDPHHRSAAAQNILACQKAYERMYAGIETLRISGSAYNAFLLANRAMFMQRVHILKQAEMATTHPDRYPNDEEIDEWLQNLNYYEESDRKAIWRPFQIAFLLMDINAVVNDQSPDRDMIDLIWFPTGGGKTEAYLGLTAFTIFYRKLAHPTESDGTAVMMRYTLRLLAAQQFTRAATLICACEHIREESARRRSAYPSYPLGSDLISIGLWIGGAHTPNKIKDAEQTREKLVNSHGDLRIAKERYNKFQVLKCPWCGTKMVCDEEKGHRIGQWGYRIDKRRGKGTHFQLFCPHERCHFHLKLPIQIVDEELYQQPPTLLFVTVDKFAMLPWEGRIGAFFAMGSVNRAPELIIQDELHLISGALGTIVGLFETAIDALCADKGTPAKIIASTATIRRAKEQCAVLYNREVAQFPPPGLNAADSFFAKESTIDYSKGVYGRKYVGIMPSGKTKAILEIRLMAALLQRLYTMDLPEEVKDKFWTLTVYFNTLKELGKASTFANDDVKDFIKRTAYRMFMPSRQMTTPDELTSRVSTTELNETLNKLEKIAYSKDNLDAKKYATNILLATNMISVGIDVARLNAMMLLGQPKLTSEYIQATSRVGRSYPGVVFVQYDATKSRDRSHYERFCAYHDSFYRFVEPTGATPFSKPARARALHSVITALVRQKTGLTGDADAIHFNRADFSDELREIEVFIVDRMVSINHLLDNHNTEDPTELRKEMEDFLQRWERCIDACATDDSQGALYFGQKFMLKPPSAEEGRLLKAYGSAGKDPAIDTLTSMRHVDTPVYGAVILWEGAYSNV